MNPTKQLSPKLVLFNAAAALVMLVGALTFLRTSLFPQGAEACSTRFTSGTLFALERDGALMTGADLQARLGGRDLGVLDNVGAARLSEGPIKAALTVRLAKGAAAAHSVKTQPGGTSFPWEPHSIQGKTAACLGYSIFLPADFDFHHGGTLPGIFGAPMQASAPDSNPPGFWARVGWREGGEGEVSYSVTGGTELQTTAIGRGSFALPRGRWARLEQEVVLNSAGAADGILRLWVDGKLAFEVGDLQYRNGNDVTVAGVSADVFYGSDDPATAAPSDTNVLLSAFELRAQ